MTSPYYLPQRKEYDTSKSETEADPYDNKDYLPKSDERTKEDNADDNGQPINPTPGPVDPTPGPVDPSKKPADTPADPGEESSGGGWAVFWILFILLLLAGGAYYVKWRRDEGLPLNPFQKDSYASSAFMDNNDQMKQGLA
jgi:hypothetical protein